MKLGVSGKGGSGKTTVSALLCRALEQAGRDVIALDADSNANLAYALGVPEAEKIRPLAEMEDLIREKTGAEKGRYGAWFKMNPEVSDIPARFCHTSGTVKLLVMGSVDRGGGGCQCPEYTLIKALISHLLLNGQEDMVVDMEAGLEHLGRGVTEKVDALLVVVQPYKASAVTAGRVLKLAKDLKIKRVFGVGNGIRRPADEAYIRREAPKVEFLAFLPHDEGVAACAREGKSIFEVAELRRSAADLADRVRKAVC